MSEEHGLTIYQAPHLMPAMSMADAADRFNALATFTGRIMREGVDYGAIPGTGGKPTLLKPGAEKLTTFFGLSVRFTLVEKAEDWTGKDHGGEPFFYYWFRCQAWRGDLLIAEADGSCNSWEQKYRYRQGKRVCPQCHKDTIIKGKDEYGGGWICFRKSGGCGAKWNDGDQAIEGQQVGNIINPNPADVVNTVQKMAQKRALVAVVLLAVNASEYYTQDLEDMVIEGAFTETKVPAPEPKPERRAEPAPDTGGSGAIKTPTQLLEAIKPLGYYRDGKHALNTYNKQAGEALGTWPANDAAFYNRALGILTEYAQAQTAQKVISETASQMAIPA